MNMNELIYKVSELFKDRKDVKIYTYNGNMHIYAADFSNIEFRKLYRITQTEHVVISLTTNSNNKVAINLEIEKEE